MTTALAFDLFLDEHDVLLDNKLTDHINSEMKSWSKKASSLSVVVNEKPENKMFFHKAKNDNSKNEMLFNKAQDEKPEIKFVFSEGSFFGNQNIDSQSNNPENENPENEMKYLEKVRKDMTKGYMSLLSNYNG